MSDTRMIAYNSFGALVESQVANRNAYIAVSTVTWEFMNITHIIDLRFTHVKWFALSTGSGLHFKMKSRPIILPSLFGLVTIKPASQDSLAISILEIGQGRSCIWLHIT